MPKTIGERFMRETSFPEAHAQPSDQSRGVAQPPLQRPWSGDTVVDLPAPGSISVPPIDLRRAIEERRSVRTYSEVALTLDELTWLLWATQGVRRAMSDRTYRNVPSGGARHPFETYLMVRNVTGVPPGLWRYAAIEHKLVAIDLERPDLVEAATSGCADQTFVGKCGVLFMWACVPYRVTWRYQERGYRDMHIDAGHVCQNLYLACEPIGCGACAILAYDDKAMNELLRLDTSQEWLIYCATVGKKLPE